MRFLLAIIVGVAVWTSPAQSQICDGDAQGLGQNWPDGARNLWYSAGIGSRLLPDAWYRALSRADDGTPFASKANLARYGFRFCTPESRDPIGFVQDQDRIRPAAIGLTCAACHTGRLTDGTHDFTVHGGAAAMDMQGFTADLFAAVLKVRSGPYDTAVQTEDWLAFSEKVLGKAATTEASTALHQAVSEWLQSRKDVQGSIHNGGNWGFGRQDAMTVALNAVAALSGNPIKGALPAANAPVSIPSLWLTHDMPRLQWTGTAAANVDMGLSGSQSTGRIMRDVSEAIGTFAEVALPDDAELAKPGYVEVQSSVRVENLIRLERAIAALTPPKWPREWGVIDRASADYKAGEALYSSHCAACHARVVGNERQAVQDAANATKTANPAADPPLVRMVNAISVPGETAASVGTDPLAACNVFTHASWGGKLTALTDTLLAMEAYTADATAAKATRFAPGTDTLRLLSDLSLRILWNKRGDVLDVPDAALAQNTAEFFAWFTTGAAVDGGNWTPAMAADNPAKSSPHRQVDLDTTRKLCGERLASLRQTNPGTPVPAYKAGPLAGIFATAPYLHNGSVPTLDALLSEPDARPDQFSVGAVLFDPVKVGLGAAIKGGANGDFKVTDLRGRIVPGNSNEGHVYPTTPLTEVQRAQLILYLKGL